MVDVPEGQRSDPVSVRQWVVTVGLALHAEESARRASSVDLTTALILADTASEAALGILSGQAPEALQSDSYGEHLNRAQRVASIPAALVAELRDIRKIRNSAVHQGADVGSLDAARAIAAARQLLDAFVPQALRDAKALGYGRGIGDAVASLIPEHPIAPALEASQLALQSDPKTSLERTSEALKWAEYCTTPELPTRDRPWSIQWPYPRERLEADFQREFERLAKMDRELATWVVPLALGLSPAGYRQLIKPLPHSIRMRDGFNHHWDPEANPSIDEARRSLEGVAYLVLRLWSMDLLRFPDEFRPSAIDVPTE
jgi:hypothetical protein